MKTATETARPGPRRRHLPGLAALTIGILLTLPTGPLRADGDLDRDGAYAGFFAGSGRLGNRFIDTRGFANWGNPGWTVKYNDSGAVGGVLVGRQVRGGGVPVRIELDATFGSLSAASRNPDPEGRDETVRAEFHWMTSLRARIDRPMGPLTVFASGGIAAARITNSVTDIDFFEDRPPAMDPDDSFREGSMQFGWAAGIGMESPLRGPWALRLEGSFLDFGKRTYEVNHSGNNRCGAGGAFTPCPYGIRNRIGILRLAIVRYFGS